MSKTKRILAEEKIEPAHEKRPDQRNEEKFLVVEVWYDKGEMNRSHRGYWLHVGIEGREDRGNGITIRSFGLGEGISSFLQPAERFNAKKLATLPVPEEKVKEYRERVIARFREKEAKYEAERKANEERAAATAEKGEQS